MVPGALLVADNAISRQADLQPMIDAALSDPRVDALVVPIDTGELVCRKNPRIRQRDALALRDDSDWICRGPEVPS